jgi:hypothetical protein
MCRISLAGFGQSDLLPRAKLREQAPGQAAVPPLEVGFARILTANLKALWWRRHFSRHCSPVSASFEKASSPAGSDEPAVILPGT